jgi:hypothetical protein
MLLRCLHAAVLLWAPPELVWAPPELGGKAVPDEPVDDFDWLADGPWATVALLLLGAAAVMFVANALMRSNKRKRGAVQPDFDLRVAKLEQLPLTPIADAKQGPVHLEGVLELGDGALGTGPRACVYQNRAKASRATAIAAEVTLLSDGTGVVGLAKLEGARVISPKEDQGPHEIIALYLGDRVEVVGEMSVFETPQTAGGRELRGMLGWDGQIQVRVTSRPEHPVHAKPSSPTQEKSEAP